MSNWITVKDEATGQIDGALSDIERLAKAGYVGTSIIDPKKSQLIDDEGTLKFYSAVTGIITAIT